MGFVVAVPLALALGSTHALLYDPNTYQSGYARYNIGPRTGLSQAELQAATDSFIRFFEGRGALDVTIERDGRTRLLFNERELHHMDDVRALFWLGDRVAGIAALYIAAFIVVGLLTRRLRGRELALLGFAGSALTFLIALVFGLASLADFEELFLRFHMLSFANDLWMLDPRRDYLIAMFPQPFWFDCAMRIAAMTLGGAALIAVASTLYLRLTLTPGGAHATSPGEPARSRPS